MLSRSRRLHWGPSPYIFPPGEISDRWCSSFYCRGSTKSPGSRAVKKLAWLLICDYSPQGAKILFHDTTGPLLGKVQICGSSLWLPSMILPAQLFSSAVESLSLDHSKCSALSQTSRYSRFIHLFYPLLKLGSFGITTPNINIPHFSILHLPVSGNVELPSNITFFSTI